MSVLPEFLVDRPRRAGSQPLLLLACAAVALGVYLRIAGINRKSLWIDEVGTVFHVSEPKVMGLFSRFEESPQAPLYYTMLWGWVRAWGLDDLSVRSLSTCFGLLALPVTYFTWRPLLGRRAMLWAMALLALNSYHIAYSQDAKMYAMIWLLATASSGCYLSAIAGTPRRTAWLVGYGISAACLPMVSHVGIVPVAVQGLYGLILIGLSPRRRWLVFDAGLVAMLAMIPTAFYLPITLSAASQRTGITWIPDVTWDRVPVELYRFLGSLLLGYRPSQEAPAGPWGMLLAGIYGPCVVASSLLLAGSAVGALRRLRAAARAGTSTPSPPSVAVDPWSAEVVAYLAMWFVAPVAGALVFSLTVYSLWGVPRYLFGAAPALILWLGAALGRLRRGRLAFGMGGALLAANLLVVLFGQFHYTRAPWREMARCIKDVAVTVACLGIPIGPDGVADPGEVIVSVCSIGQHEFEPLCLEYALDHDPTTPTRVRAEFIRLEEALERRQPFLVVMIVYMGPTRPDGMRKDLERAVPDHACRQVYWETAYQEPYTSMPTPFTWHSVEVWLCTPLHSNN
jgi:uncharacterized membrane protein